MMRIHKPVICQSTIFYSRFQSRPLTRIMISLLYPLKLHFVGKTMLDQPVRPRLGFAKHQLHQSFWLVSKLSPSCSNLAEFEQFVVVQDRIHFQNKVVDNIRRWCNRLRLRRLSLRSCAKIAGYHCVYMECRCERLPASYKIRWLQDCCRAKKLRP